MKQLDYIQKGKVVLFTGTRADVNSLRKFGVLAGGLDRPLDIDPLTQKYVVNKERTLKRVLDEFGLEKWQVPRWCYEYELQYEKDEPIHIHFCLNFENAQGYSDMGGEPAYCIRENILNWLNNINDMPPKENIELKKSISEQAKLGNGIKRYVVVTIVNLNDPRLQKDFLNIISHWLGLIQSKKLTEQEIERYCFQESAYEVRYYGDIKPKDILGIVQVDKPDFP